MVRSSEHVANRLECVPPNPLALLGVGSNDAHHTVLTCPPSSFVSVCAQDQSSPPGSSVQTLIESSYDTDTSASSAGCHTTCLTSWVWPLSTATHSKSWPGWTSQIHTLLSRPQVARSEPDGDHAHDLTSFSCPSTTATHSHSPDPLAGCCAHTAVLASKEAVARSRPQGDHAACRTVLLCTPSSSATVTHVFPAAALLAQILHVLSLLQVARVFPVGSHAQCHTLAMLTSSAPWPSRTASHRSVTRSASARDTSEVSIGCEEGSGSSPPLPRPRNDSIARPGEWPN
mmetsp:Transcript_8519/g.37572  ORF Transcript_8519/g.37572 Transcript_8519/m.37572 type:complete len:287 (-) Transcript_8519:2-862(-)